MKKILITGKNSYVGNKFQEWVSRYDEYQIDKITLRDENWKKVDFSKYDTILHVAGIAHNTTNSKMEKLYYSINRDLTIELAKKAKNENVSQFIFLSSIIVYGNRNLQSGIIDINTKPQPENFYGDSKLQAEKGISQLNSDNFKVAIIRPPMIYGKDSKGNYPKLVKLAKITPIFPEFENKRSMLHIDNLCEFLKAIIDFEDKGIFFPQNKQYVNTCELVKVIAEVYKKKIIMTKIFNFILIILIDKINLFNKIFGNLVYDMSMSKYDKIDYQIRTLKESIDLTEKTIY